MILNLTRNPRAVHNTSKFLSCFTLSRPESLIDKKESPIFTTSGFHSVYVHADNLRTHYFVKNKYPTGLLDLTYVTTTLNFTHMFIYWTCNLYQTREQKFEQKYSSEKYLVFICRHHAHQLPWLFRFLVTLLVLFNYTFNHVAPFSIHRWIFIMPFLLDYITQYKLIK